DVVQKEIEGGDALDETALQILPLLRRDDARQEIERENLFRAGGIAIDVERDALAEKSEVNRLAFEVKLVTSQGSEQFPETLVMRTDGAATIEHFVEERFYFVSLEQRRARFCFWLGGHFTTSSVHQRERRKV